LGRQFLIAAQGQRDHDRQKETVRKMPSQLRWMWIVIALCWADAGMVHAETQAARAVVAGVIVISGNAEERDRTAVHVGLTAATQAAGWQVPARPLSKKEVTGLQSCLNPGEPWGCIPATLDRQGVRHALVVVAEKQQSDDGSPMVRLIGKLIVTRPRALVVLQRFCERCADDKLTQAATELAQQLMQELAVRIGRTILVVKSTPNGARILLDGSPIGATDTTLSTYPGEHVVVIEKAGFTTEILTIKAEEGKTAEIAVALRATANSAAAAASPPPPPRSRLVPLGLIGAGSALIAGSGVLFVVGQRGGSDEKYRYPRGTTFAIATGGTGVAAAGVGLYLLLRGSHPNGATANVTANVTSGGAIVGWTKAF
jgi:hypothetical protein